MEHRLRGEAQLIEGGRRFGVERGGVCSGGVDQQGSARAGPGRCIEAPDALGFLGELSRHLGRARQLIEGQLQHVHRLAPAAQLGQEGRPLEVEALALRVWNLGQEPPFEGRQALGRVLGAAGDRVQRAVGSLGRPGAHRIPLGDRQRSLQLLFGLIVAARGLKGPRRAQVALDRVARDLGDPRRATALEEAERAMSPFDRQ